MVLSCTPPSSSAPIQMRPSSFKAVQAGRLAGSFTKALPALSVTPRTSHSSEASSFSRRQASPNDTPETFSFTSTASSIPSLQPVRVSAANSVVGFNIVRSPSLEASSPSRANPEKQTRGLLSSALSLELPPVSTDSTNGLTSPSKLPSLPECDPASPVFGFNSQSFFPEVDTTLLENAQERNAIFRSELVKTAYSTAAHAYRGKMRKDGCSQLSHCVLTALQLAELGLDQETVAAGLLHEVLTGNEHFRSQLQEFMPKPVVELVDRVTTIANISQLYRNYSERLNDQDVQNMLLAMQDVKAVIIALTCRVHNMKTISSLPRDKQLLFAQETLDVYSVVANRLGMWSLKAELEDLAFKVLHPEQYEKLLAQVSSRQDPAVLGTIIQRLKDGLDAAGIKYEDISGRPKNLYGIWLKMKGDGHSNLDRIYDVVALRVVVANKHDCYFVRRVLQGLYACMPERSKDFIREIKKPNGYQSLHETIRGDDGQPVEVQIRTHKMHYIAEYGFAAHWKYKENLNNEDEWLEKTVQYQKWMTNYKLGVHDKKVRANGALTDGSLKSLGMHQLDSSPEHVDPFLKHDRFRLEQPRNTNVAVFVNSPVRMGMQTFPAGSTVASVAEGVGLGKLPGYCLTINQQCAPAAPDTPLQSGDLIQVLPVEEVLSRSPPERKRELLMQHAQWQQRHEQQQRDQQRRQQRASSSGGASVSSLSSIDESSSKQQQQLDVYCASSVVPVSLPLRPLARTPAQPASARPPRSA